MSIRLLAICVFFLLFATACPPRKRMNPVIGPFSLALTPDKPDLQINLGDTITFSGVATVDSSTPLQGGEAHFAAYLMRCEDIPNNDTSCAYEVHLNDDAAVIMVEGTKKEYNAGSYSILSRLVQSPINNRFPVTVKIVPFKRGTYSLIGEGGYYLGDNYDAELGLFFNAPDHHLRLLGLAGADTPRWNTPDYARMYYFAVQ